MKIIVFLFTLLILSFPSVSIAQEKPQEQLQEQLQEEPLEQPQQICNTREVILKALEGKYKEIPVAMGLTSNNLMMELFSSPDGSTWSITFTQPNKTMCLVTGGSFLINLIGKVQKGQDINALPVE